MENLKAKYVRIQPTFTGDIELILTVPRDQKQRLMSILEKLQPDTLLDVEIKKHRNKRSLNANSYCWKLCDLIAEKAGITKEEVYQDHIGYVGSFELLSVRADTLAHFKTVWGHNGLGWVVRVLDEDREKKGHKLVCAYYGSSTYNTKEMSRLVDNLVQDAKALGIEVLDDRELSLLKEKWKRRSNE